MKYAATSSLNNTKQNYTEERMIAEKRRQAGIAFPAPRDQNYLSIVRLNINPVNDKNSVRQGLKRLCTLFEQIDEEIFEIDDTSSDVGFYSYPLTRFNFTATVGFGKQFFTKLGLEKKCPKNLYEVPAYYELGDKSPYLLPQTDLILQLASNDYTANKMVLQNDGYFTFHGDLIRKDQNYVLQPDGGSRDIMGAIEEWAKITDVQNGFHRADGKNLMGFYDGISNPYRLDNNIWITEGEEQEEVVDGTYMVFQKIEHNLNKWNKLDTQKQERWIGRSKATGLLLGTLSEDEEKRLISELYSKESSIQRHAKIRLSQLIDEQRDPTKNFFNSYDMRYLNIDKLCPVNSHARMANSRKPIGSKQRFIFRRGCLYMEEDFKNYPKSGILFISYQNDIRIFEEMKHNFSLHDSAQVKPKFPGKVKNYSGQKASMDISFDTLTLGGGYYFIPPIPDKKISEIGQQFFK